MRSYLRRARQHYTDLQLRRTARRNNFRPEDALLVFSDPRGGSTWITELLHRIPRTAIVWEPLHLRKVPAFRDIGFQWRQHIPQDATWEETHDAFEQLLSGKIMNPWTCQKSGWREFAQAERLLVKFVRGNALLPWLTDQFAFRRPPILLVRHPFAVAASQLLYFQFRGNKPPSQWRGFGSPPVGRFNDAYHEHADFLQTLETTEEVLLAQWCQTTLPTLRHPDNDKRWITVHYEHLLLNPADNLERIMSRWNTSMPAGIEHQLRQASATTNEATFLQGVEAQLQKWQKQFSSEQVARMKAVLEYFEVEFYDDGLMPLASASRPSAPTLEPAVLV